MFAIFRLWLYVLLILLSYFLLLLGLLLIFFLFLLIYCYILNLSIFSSIIPFHCRKQFPRFHLLNSISQNDKSIFFLLNRSRNKENQHCSYGMHMPKGKTRSPMTWGWDASRRSGECYRLNDFYRSRYRIKFIGVHSFLFYIHCWQVDRLLLEKKGGKRKKVLPSPNCWYLRDLTELNRNVKNRELFRNSNFLISRSQWNNFNTRQKWRFN